MRREQESRPVADMQHFNDAVGHIGAAQDERAVREIHGACRFVDDDDTDGGQRVDRSHLQAANDDHQQFRKHRRLPSGHNFPLAVTTGRGPISLLPW